MKATAKAEEEEDKEILQSEPKPEPSSENQHHETSVVQEQDSAARVPSPDPVAAELKDKSILNLQDSIPNRQAFIQNVLFLTFSLSFVIFHLLDV